MAKSTGAGQYVLLPPQGLRAKAATATTDARDFLRTAHEATGTSALALRDTRAGDLRVLDSLGPDGAKLVELSPGSLLALRAEQPELRVVPVVYYKPAVARREVVEESRPARARAGGPAAITVQVVSKSGAKPVPNAVVVAFVDFAARRGAQGVTDANGRCSLNLGGASVKLERLYVYPLDAHWSLLKKNLTLTDGTKLVLTPLDLGAEDGVRHFYGNADLAVGKGVTVAVVDTGSGPHPDLVIAGGANTVQGEDPKDFSDNGHAHGTHVAGIVAARGAPPAGIRGVAPGVKLRAYRVFGKGQGSASSFAIAKAVDKAVADKCDLINMSLGGGQPDPVLKAAVDDARAGGSVCIIAAGNDDRSAVSFPASEAMALAVSALGRKGTFPSTATESDEVGAPFGSDKKDFIAKFSNIGPEVDLTGPGVAIISTVPSGYAEMSGTSMACPAVTGAAARAIAGSAVLKAKRDAKRSAAIVKAIVASAHTLGFQPVFEGHGLPEPK
ncbi:MAG TPA: S8 family serine peptidase [Acidimicrobiales bacterium]|nr:S8 family serine peptidase [Acidimicrobiales bacterium]